MIKLYDFTLSGNCYKLRLFMDILGIEYETVNIDFYPGFEHKKDSFLEINPLGQLPVLQDGDLVLRDAQAILVHLAANYDGSDQWFPIITPRKLGEVTMWLSFADQITATASLARLILTLGYPGDSEHCQQGAHKLFRILDEHIWFAEKQNNHWLVAGDHPTVADIACFPYVALSEEGGVMQQEYPAIRRWLNRVKRIPGFSYMPGIFPASDARAA